jgi:hypothetical protein
MFVRTATRRNKDGTAVRYLQLVHNEWDPATKSAKMRVLHNFGREDQLDRAAIEQLAGSLCRLLDPGRAAALREPGLAYTGSAAFGEPWLLDQLWQRLGIGPILTARAVGAENLCHQAILVNHASGTVTPPDPEMVQVGDAIWQRAQRRGLVQGAVWPVRVVEVLVLVQHDHQMPLIPYQGPVQQLTPATADPAFHDRVHSRRLNSGADNPDASGLEDGVERGGKAGVPVVQDELCPCPGVFQVHEQVPGLLHYP